MRPGAIWGVLGVLERQGHHVYLPLGLKRLDPDLVLFGVVDSAHGDDVAKIGAAGPSRPDMARFRVPTADNTRLGPYPCPVSPIRDQGYAACSWGISTMSQGLMICE